MVADELVVSFIGAEHRVASDDGLTFGRAADVVVDEDNRYLNRVVGQFVWQRDLWWVVNLSDTIGLLLEGDDGTLVRLPRGKRSPLTWRHVFVRFSAGGLPYEIEAARPAAEAPAAPRVVPLGGLPTTRYGQVVLTAEERDLLVELARPFLLDPNAGPERLPSNRQVAANLAWRPSKLNRKLDYLCKRVAAAGVSGLLGERAHLAANRRWVLVQHALATGLITTDDL